MRINSRGGTIQFMKKQTKSKHTLTIKITGKTASGKSVLRDILRNGLQELGWPCLVVESKPHELYTTMPR